MALRDGNHTLPILLALQQDERAVIEAFECPQPTEKQIADALHALRTGNAIQEAKTISRRFAEDALKSIKRFPPSMYRNGLKTLVQLVTDRDF